MALVGVVGDFDPGNHTHQATNHGLTHASIDFEWVSTDQVPADRAEPRLARYSGILVAPWSPYRSMAGALAAIRFARERGVPLVGT